MSNHFCNESLRTRGIDSTVHRWLRVFRVVEMLTGQSRCTCSARETWRVSRAWCAAPVCTRTRVKGREARQVSCARLLTLLTKYWPASWEMSVSFYRHCRTSAAATAATIIAGGLPPNKFKQVSTNWHKAPRDIFFIIYRLFTITIDERKIKVLDFKTNK